MVDGRHTWGGGVPVKRSFVALEELRFCLELRSVGCAKPRMCCEQRLCASAAQSVQVLRPLAQRELKRYLPCAVQHGTCANSRKARWPRASFSRQLHTQLR